MIPAAAREPTSAHTERGSVRHRPPRASRRARAQRGVGSVWATGRRPRAREIHRDFDHGGQARVWESGAAISAAARRATWSEPTSAPRRSISAKRSTSMRSMTNASSRRGAPSPVTSRRGVAARRDRDSFVVTVGSTHIGRDAPSLALIRATTRRALSLDRRDLPEATTSPQ